MKSFFLKNKVFLLLLFCCLPLLFINVKNSHDWGDDFAQYFLQAKNIVEHKPQTDNGLVLDKVTDPYSFKAYPVGFPLMLAAVWEIHGYSIKAFSMLISILLIGFALLTFLYLRKTFSSVLSFVLVLAIIYNPVLLYFKKEILSDIPFAFFLLLSLFLFQAENKSKTIWWSLLTGILFGWAISLRGIGMVLFIALPLWMIVSAFLKSKNNQSRLYLNSFLVFILYVIVLLIYPYQAGGFRFLIPIIPFMLKYMGMGIKTALEIVRLPKAQIITVVIVALTGLQNMNSIREIVRNQNTIENGPQSLSARSTLEFIKSHLPDDAVIAFSKPRALAFYAEKKAACISRKLSVEQMHEAFQRMNTNYYLLNISDPELNDPKLKDYVLSYKDDLKPIWQNDDFIIYANN